MDIELTRKRLISGKFVILQKPHLQPHASVTTAKSIKCYDDCELISLHHLTFPDEECWSRLYFTGHRMKGITENIIYNFTMDNYEPDVLIVFDTKSNDISIRSFNHIQVDDGFECEWIPNAKRGEGAAYQVENNLYFQRI